ncbi:alpha/beta fold hydrolase [Sphingobacterium haloxyli]|uniref:Alpha/beta hydrolase n=1 Tax=Sphingobacterium haloxyli TaxID=2100533 RepID=A0A2S9IUB3_9SPHI|nr:alpha/beta hydrolase [Sphingobacterium haloxyli]PRD44116.1 alpha/beta hydrolase [Sphingobacterium haloxyli]
MTLKRRKRKLWVSILILSAIMMSLAGIALYDSCPVGYWRSSSGYLTYKKTYSKAMGLLPTPSHTLDIRTSYGVVRVYKWQTEKTESAAPIILIPGRSAGAPMWSDNLPAFLAKHPVYAIDALGDAGMSIQTVQIGDGADQARWLHEVMSSLHVTQAHIVGHSFGGWAAANYATRYPEKIASLVLLEPICVFQGLKTTTILKTIPSAIPFLPKRWRERMIEDISGAAEIDYDDPVARMIAEGTEYYAEKLPGLPERITAEQLCTWQMPVYVAMGAKSVMHDAEKAVAFAREHIKCLQAKEWEGGTHSLPMDFPNEINAEILTFISAVAPSTPSSSSAAQSHALADKAYDPSYPHPRESGHAPYTGCRGRSCAAGPG